jgi:retron-type reverse transcriptase
MQEVITKTVHANQYGFIKGRTIQDCLAWSFEYLHQCQQSTRKIVVIKIDFEKAFDTLDHDALIQVIEGNMP